MEGITMNQNNMNAEAVKFASRLQEKYPVEVAVGVGIILPNLVNGCSWGFVPETNTEYVKILDAINKNKKMSSFRIANGYLFTMQMDYLLQVLSSVAGGLVTVQDLNIASDHRQESLVKTERYLRKRSLALAKGEAEKIGIYNLNDSPRITVDGDTYAAFCITLVDLLAFCVRNGYNILVSNKGHKKILTPGQASNNIVKIIENCSMSPSGNALLINIVKA